MKSKTQTLIKSSALTCSAIVAAMSAEGSGDYGPAIWRPACSGHWYTSGYGKKFYVIHDMEGYYWSTISFFQNCNTSASVHYCVNGVQDTGTDAPAGEVTQMVADVNYAWHVGCWNRYCMGTEHEGFADNPAWYSTAMYQASAALTKSKCEKYGIAKDRTHVVAHGQWQDANWRNYAAANFGINPNCNTHTDPGPYWDWNYYMSLINTVRRKHSDFDGNGTDDVVTFLRGTSGDVYVGTSAVPFGSAFANGALWNDYFCAGTEIPVVGDFNGDHRTDVATFTRGTTGDVYVGLSVNYLGANVFAAGTKWNDWFCLGSEIPLAGDFNGDGRDDVVTFTRGTDADVYVGLSVNYLGTDVFTSGTKWHDYFCANTDIPCVGDVNGDGKDDIISFSRGSGGYVWVALSTGNGFGPAQLWRSGFCLNSEIPAVGDFNGDGKADIATFTRGTQGYVYVALSTGNGFAASTLWNNHFCLGSELPGVGDFNGDGRADIVTFTRGSTGDVYVGTSVNCLGTDVFTSGTLWNDWFCAGSEIPLPGPTAALTW